MGLKYGDTMKTVQIKLRKVILALVAIGIPAFIIGWLMAVNFSGVFETGYKMAFMDIKSAIKESAKDRKKYFYMNGIKFSTEKLKLNIDTTSIKVVSIDRGDRK